MESNLTIYPIRLNFKENNLATKLDNLIIFLVRLTFCENILGKSVVILPFTEVVLPQRENFELTFSINSKFNPERSHFYPEHAHFFLGHFKKKLGLRA